MTAAAGSPASTGPARDPRAPLSPMALEVRWSSRILGDVTVDGAARLVFPPAPTTPAIYLLIFRDGRVYVGETDNLARRLQHYRTPGARQPTNLRINSALRADIEAGGVVTVHVIDEATADGAELDLERESNRVLLEHAVIYCEARSEWRLLNL